MKFILFDIQDVKSIKINKLNLDDNNYINEIVFSRQILDFMALNPQTLIDKVKYKIYDKRIEKIILKSIEKYNNKWNYILSKNLQLSDGYIKLKAEQLLGYKLNVANEMNDNIFKYIDEYLNNEEFLKSYEVKVLLVATNINNLNMALIEKMVKQYKTVNIYLKDNVSEYILKRIKQINKHEGTTIEILKKERKSFVEYNVIYFIDDYNKNYPRFRFNKNALVLDSEQIKHDKYNSNIIYLNKLLEKPKTCVENIQEMQSKYEYLGIAQAVNKITNSLDKS